MDKGIRPAAIAKFLADLPARVNTREGNTKFRKGVIAYLEEQFGCTHAAGATHYNHAFIEARKKAGEMAANGDTTLQDQLVGLGRPEDKKGGRKKKVVAAAPTTETPAATEGAVTGAELIEGSNLEPSDDDATLDDVPAPETAPQTFSVYKVSDGTLVAEGLTREQADELVEKAKAAKKSKLEVR